MTWVRPDARCTCPCHKVKGVKGEKSQKAQMITKVNLQSDMILMTLLKRKSQLTNGERYRRKETEKKIEAAPSDSMLYVVRDA